MNMHNKLTNIGGIKMNRITREIIGQSQAETNTINAHLITLGSMVDTLKKFDGKVVNVRLANELHTAAAQPVRITKSYDGKATFLEFRHGKPAEVDGALYYAQWHKDCIVPIMFQECGKRLDASATIINMDKELLQLHGKIRNYNVPRQHIETVHTQLNALKKEISELLAAQDNPFLRDSIRESLKYIP
jgi:hypothetical protein